MTKASQTIGYKNADTPYLEAEWVGSYAEAVSGATGDIPHFIGKPNYIIPRKPPEEVSIDPMTGDDGSARFFKITTNIDYRILCSDEPLTKTRASGGMSSSEGDYVVHYSTITIPTYQFFKTTDFMHSETLVFMNEQFKNLSKIPDSITQIQWVGKPSQSDLNITVRNGRIDLGQKAIGALLIVYMIKSDVYSATTKYWEAFPNHIFWVQIVNAPRIFGIFATDESALTTSLRLDPEND